MLPRWRALSLAAIAAAALGCEAMENSLLRRPAGERLYRKHCASCHGIDGSGNTPLGMANPLNDLIDDMWKHGGDAGSMQVVIRDGVLGSMPAHPELSDLEIRQIVDHVLKLGGRSRGPR